MLHIIDTYAWVEYLNGSRKGTIVRHLLADKNNEFLTIECTVAELRGWALKENASFRKIYSAIKANSHFEAVYLEDWIEAADIKSELRKRIKDFGLMDALLLAKQRKYRCKLISGDPHFSRLPGVVYLK